MCVYFNVFLFLQSNHIIVIPFTTYSFRIVLRTRLPLVYTPSCVRPSPFRRLLMRARLLVLGPASVPSLRRAACASNLHALTTFKAFKAPLSASSANALATTRAPASLPVPCIALSTRPTTLLPLQRLLAFPRREMGTKYKVPKMKPRQAQPSVPKLEEPVQTV